MKKCLRRHGELVGACPVAVFLVSLVVFLAVPATIFGIQLKQGSSLWNEDGFSLTWAESGGDLETNLRLMKEHEESKHEHSGMMRDWLDSTSGSHFTMVYGKGSRKSTDILTPEVLSLTLPLLKKWTELSVTTKSGMNYSTFDLCKRGLKPDSEDTAFIMPCEIFTPHACFKEYTETLHPTWASLVDPIAPLLSPSLLSFSTRPSFINMTTDELKAEVSRLKYDPTGTLPPARGCQYFTTTFTMEPSFWGGEVTWTNSSFLAGANGIRFMFSYEPPANNQFRMSLSRPNTSLAEVKEAQELHAQLWQQHVEDYANTLDETALELANLKPGFLEEAQEASEKIQWTLILASVILLHSYVFFASADFRRPLQSRACLAFGGMMLVHLSLLFSMSVFFTFGFKMNSAIAMSVPFLQMGLGADDIFVIMHVFNELDIDFLCTASCRDILGQVCCRGGAGVLLTSVCNSVAFIAGTFVPIPGLSNMCAAIAICTASNFVVAITAFLALLCLEARRVRRGSLEWHPFMYLYHRSIRAVRGPRPAPAKGLTDYIEDWVATFYAPALVRVPVKCGVSIVALLLLVGAFWKASEKSVGWNPSITVPDGHHSQRPLEMTFDHFSFFGAQLVFHDIDVVENQQGMIELYDQLTTTDHTRPQAGAPYLTVFYSLLTRHAKTLADTLIGSTSEGNALDDTALAPSNTSLGGNGSRQLALDDLGWKTNQAGWKHPKWAPNGLAPSDPQVFYEAYHYFASAPFDDPSKGTAVTRYTYEDMDQCGHNSFAFMPGPLKQFKLSWFGVFLVDLNSDEVMTESIDELNRILDDSGLKGRAFLHSPIFTYWTAFLKLEDVFRMLFAVSLSIIAFVSFCLLASASAALISMLCSAMIVVECFGLCVLVGLKFNPFIVAALLSATGLSVEFISHTITSFTMASDVPPEQRLGAAMKQTYVPILHGSMSTLFAILPMFFAPVGFVRMYIFWPTIIVVFVGMLNAFLFLPALLAAAQSCTNVFWRAVAPCQGASGQENAVQDLEQPTKQPAEQPAHYPVVLGTRPGDIDGNPGKKVAVAWR